MASTNDLRRIPLLASLDEFELARLSSEMTFLHPPKGRFLMKVNEEGTTMMFLLKGKVKVVLAGPDGREVTICHLEEGDCFGELALLTGEKRVADVIAVTDCEVASLEKSAFERHIAHHNGFLRSLLKTLAFRLRDSSDKIGEIVLFDVHTRLVRVLYGMGKKEEREGETVSIVTDRPTHQELAGMIGTSREVVSRAFRRLEDEKFIEVDGKEITVRLVPRR